MAVLFWVCLSVIGYVYLGYPLLMWLLATWRGRERSFVSTEWPTVSLIIAARNEEGVLAAKLDNATNLDYPADKLEIIVASDGSTDRTDAIARDFEGRGVRLLRGEGWQGKTAVQNAAVAAAAGEIVVFSDANAIYQPDALKRLVARFADPSVGCVEGRRADFVSASSTTGRAEVVYRDWESRVKAWESQVRSCVGASGPIYAVRRSLYVPLDPAMISDFMEPLLIMCRHGRRQVFEPAAVSSEAVLPELRDEFRRKVRIMTRCLNSLRMAPEVLDPRRSGWFAMQVISHRLLRWMVPLFAIGAFAANLFLLDRAFYRGVFLAQVLFAAAAAAGIVLDRWRIGPAFVRFPYAFCVANLASLVAVGNCLLGRNVVTWQPQRA